MCGVNWHALRAWFSCTCRLQRHQVSIPYVLEAQSPVTTKNRTQHNAEFPASPLRRRFHYRSILGRCDCATVMRGRARCPAFPDRPPGHRGGFVSGFSVLRSVGAAGFSGRGGLRSERRRGGPFPRGHELRRRTFRILEWLFYVTQGPSPAACGIPQ